MSPATLSSFVPMRRAFWLLLALVLFLCLFALPDIAHAGAVKQQADRLMERLGEIFVIVRNVLFGLAAFGLLVIGGAALMGRFNAKWLWTIGGAVVLMGVSGMVVNQLIDAEGTAAGTTTTEFGTGRISDTDIQ